eukprot:6460870-Prymnesium_polylepis.1
MGVCGGARSPRASARGEHSGALRSRAAAVASPPLTRRPPCRPSPPPLPRPPPRPPTRCRSTRSQPP